MSDDSRDELDSTSSKDNARAWLVAFSSHGVHILTYGVVWSSAVFYLIFLKAFDESQEKTALLGSLMNAILYASGPLAGFLGKHLGYRRLIFFGGLLAGSGMALSSLVSNINIMFITYSVISGLGFGLASITSIFAVPQHFETKKTIALGLAASGVGVGTFLYPPLLGFLMEKYDYSGVLLICGGLTFNICVLALIMPTSDKHKVKRNFEEEVTKKDLKGIILEDMARISHMFKNKKFLALSVNNLLFCFSLIFIHIHLSAFIKFRFDVTFRTSAMFVSILGGSNLVGRLTLGLICHIKFFKNICVYALTLTVCAFAVLLFSIIDDIIVVAICCAVYGFCSASLGTIMPDILTDILEAQDFGYGYGFTLIFESIGTLVGGPISGYLLDNFKDYTYLFLISAVVNLTSVFIFLLPYFNVITQSKILKRHCSFN